MVAGLDRLKVILVTYQDTLATVEASDNDTSIKAELAKKGGSNNASKHLNLTVAALIADVEETVEDSVQDYDANVVLDAEIDAVVEETEAEEAAADADMDTAVAN